MYPSPSLLNHSLLPATIYYPSIHPIHLYVFNHTAIHPFNHALLTHPPIYLNSHSHPLSICHSPSIHLPPLTHPSIICLPVTIHRANHLSVHSSIQSSSIPFPSPITHQYSESENVTQSSLTLCHSMDCSPPGSSAMEFSRQEYWSGLPFPSPGNLPNLRTEPGSSALQADSSPSEPQGKTTYLDTSVH